MTVEFSILTVTNYDDLLVVLTSRVFSLQLLLRLLLPQLPLRLRIQVLF
jgi:hypothetical protein